MGAGIERGAGMGGYLPWAVALLEGVPNPLEPSTQTLSPAGFPLLHQFPGTGVFLALPALFTGGTVAIGWSVRLAALTAILIAIGSCASILYRIARHSVGLLLFGMALLLVATNAGYYLRLLGSELFAFSLVSAALWLAWPPKGIGYPELAGLSALSTLLVTVRPQSIIMMAPVLVLASARWGAQQTRSSFAKGFLVSLPPIIFGLCIIFQLNYWMTGEWTAGTLTWGHSSFKPVDISGRFLKFVLFDEGYGAFRYTPFLVLGLLTSLWHIFDRTLDKGYRIFYIAALLAGVAQIWIISGFYFWSGGMRGFGSRYLNLLSLYAVIAVVHILASERFGTPVKVLVTGISVACAVYSGNLLGLPYSHWLSLTIAAIAVWLIVWRKDQLSRIVHIVYGSLGISILCSIFLYYASKVLSVTSVGSRLDMPWKLAIILVVALAILLALPAYFTWSLFRTSFPKILAVASVVVLVIEFSLIVRLRIQAGPYQARQLASPGPQFLYKNTIEMRNLALDVESPEEAYRWSAHERQALKEFVEDEKRRTAIRR